MDLLRQILPGVKRLGMLGDPNDPVNRLLSSSACTDSRLLGLDARGGRGGSSAQFELAVAGLIANRSEAIFPGSVLAYNLRGRLIELANEVACP